MRGERASRVAIEKMIKYCDDIVAICESNENSRERFEDDIQFQYACAMCFVQIGEMVGRLSDEFILSYPAVPWRQLKGLRNIYAHDYERINNDMVWEAITEEIPIIRTRLAEVLDEIA